MNDLFGLREYQAKAIEKIESLWISGTKRICYQLPTGGGKSKIIRAIVDNHWKGKKVIYIIVHRRSLVEQLSLELSDADIRHGLVTPDDIRVPYRVQVASLQTLARRAATMPAPEIIIIDEVHHVKAKSYMDLLSLWPDALVLGVTATPSRPDGSPLRDVMQALVLGPSMRELMAGGFLSDYDYFAPSTVDMSGARVVHGEYSAPAMVERVGRKIIGDAVEHYKRHADHQPAIVSCASIAHAETVAQQFRDAGYKAYSVNSKMDGPTIRSRLQGLKSGTLEVLTQCELLGEGVDIPGATVLIGLRPTASLVIFLQHVGRVLRKAPGKNKAIILDHVGNWERHGLPDDDRTWSLDGEAKSKETSAFKRCPKCLRIVKAYISTCPHCGYSWAGASPVERIPETAEGQLVDVRKERETKVSIDWETLCALIKDKAPTLSAAIQLAKNYGFNHHQAWAVWTRVLKRTA